MDLFVLLFLSCVSFLVGVVLTIVIQYYAFINYFQKNPAASPPKKPHIESSSLPENLKKKLEADGYDGTDSSLAVNLLFQFLFNELRHADSIKRWLYKKLTLEFEELITKTTTGKFFDNVTIRDMNMGSEFPDIQSISIDSVKLDKNEGHVDTLNLCIKLDYSGNFSLSVVTRMKFGKTGYLSIKVKHISGSARLQFTRLPYTHWSFSFYGDPVIELAVESHFQGRQLQSNVSNLIVNQIKKAIKRKHILPNYKIRYKPFFMKTDPGQLDLEESEIIPQGQLECLCIEMSRLAITDDIVQVYCTLAVDSSSWICLYQKESIMYVVLELTISKLKQQPIGVTFKQEQNTIFVDCVIPQSVADKATLKSGDILLAIDGKSLNSIVHINRFLKLLPGGNFSIRIKRIVGNYTIKSKYVEKTDLKTPLLNTNSINDCDLSQVESDGCAGDAKTKNSEETPKKTKTSDKIVIPKLLSSSNENVSKLAHTLGNFALRKRKTSIERTSNDGSNKTTPTQSSPSTPQHLPMKQSSKIDLISESLEVENDETELEGTPVDCTEIWKGKLNEAVCVVNCNDEFSFNLKDTDKYLNINVFGVTKTGKDVLLGYTNISLSQILTECNNSMLGHYVKRFSFLPPTSTPPTSHSHPLISHSGFEHVFCYGDALLSFMWTHDETAELKRQILTDKEIVASVSTKHDFIRTQFHRTTHCDFCSKKIWLKDAVQCKTCNLCCHKKCLTKCQLSVPCTTSERSDKTELNDLLQPEITMTEVPPEDLDLHCGTSDQIQSFNSLKRVNSANNLAIPGNHVSTCQSRSLPPSPQRTPRKLSLVASNPFSVCLGILDEVHQLPNMAPELIERTVEQVLQYPLDESLMDAAKDTGIQLYANMEHQMKVEKINLMVTELKKSLDEATLEHMTLTKDMSNSNNEVEKAKFAFQIGQADAKIQALSVLMLHYCSGLQHTKEKIV